MASTSRNDAYTAGNSKRRPTNDLAARRAVWNEDNRDSLVETDDDVAIEHIMADHRASRYSCAD